MKATIQQLLNGTRTAAAIDTIIERTGMSRPSIFALVGSLKKEGLGAYDKDHGTITLTEKGIGMVQHETVQTIAVHTAAVDMLITTEVMTPTIHDMVVSELPTMTESVATNPVVDAPQVSSPTMTQVSAVDTIAPTSTVRKDAVKTGVKGRAPDPTSKRAKFEAWMALNPTLPRKDKLAHAVQVIGLTEQGAGTYIYNYNKTMKATGGTLVSGHRAPVAKVNIPDSVAQPVAAVDTTPAK